MVDHSPGRVRTVVRRFPNGCGFAGRRSVLLRQTSIARGSCCAGSLAKNERVSISKILLEMAHRKFLNSSKLPSPQGSITRSRADAIEIRWIRTARSEGLGVSPDFRRKTNRSLLSVFSVTVAPLVSEISLLSRSSSFFFDDLASSCFCTFAAVFRLIRL